MDTEFRGYVFIDVRSKEDFDAAHVAGAINITVGEISEQHTKLKDLDKKSDIVVYCAAGGRASQAKLKLEALGFENVTNGINKENVERHFL
jgi:phage shock protein E